LLTLLGLYQHGYEVGRFISLERLVEESRDDYYEALRKSSEDWHEAKHDLIPWLNYFLGVLRRAYREFQQDCANEVFGLEKTFELIAPFFVVACA
jgi:Fic family protein